MIEHPILYSLTFVLGQTVCAIIGYIQGHRNGRRGEELRWRRVVGNLDVRTGQAPVPGWDEDDGL